MTPSPLERIQAEQRECAVWLAENTEDHPEWKLALMGLGDWVCEEVLELLENLK